MPLNHYECQSCGHQHEALQRFDATPLTDCPSCHKSTLIKQIQASGFVLKGDGWYKDNYLKPNKKKSDSSSSSE